MPQLQAALIFLLTFSSTSLGRATVGNWDACGGRLERALDALHRDSTRRNRLAEEEAGVSYQQELRSAPLEMSVSRIAVKIPQGARDSGGPWARVERCTYEPNNNSLQTRVIFSDLSVSGMVSLMPRDRKPPIPAESCRMSLRLRRAGIDFTTSPIARGRGQIRIRTESSFLEPRFASIYAYGCRPTRHDKQIKRQDKWPPYHPPRDEFAVLPLAPSDNYEAAEPRQLVGVSKEVDVVIPNESRQPRFLHTPVAKLGIWRKNVWVTKSPTRERRSLGIHRDSNETAILNRTETTTIADWLESTVLPEQGKDLASRIPISIQTITPLDFATALNKRSVEASNYTLGNRTTAWENSTEDPARGKDFEGAKTNVKREDVFEMKREDVPRETRELYLDENIDNVFPNDFEHGSRSWQSKEYIAREMEDVFLKGASQALTRYIERQLHPAIKETLMLSMGYTISYG
ncbi:hypothetical protein KM043_011952 [Ampulex compressa]|nr:hypothetical protein KM043_011952 [Ampulex compressa]